MAHPARGPAVPRTAVSLHKHSTGHVRPSTPEWSSSPPQRYRGRGCLPPGEAYARAAAAAHEWSTRYAWQPSRARGCPTAVILAAQTRGRLGCQAISALVGHTHSNGCRAPVPLLHPQGYADRRLLWCGVGAPCPELTGTGGQRCFIRRTHGLGSSSRRCPREQATIYSPPNLTLPPFDPGSDSGSMAHLGDQRALPRRGSVLWRGRPPPPPAFVSRRRSLTQSGMLAVALEDAGGPGEASPTSCVCAGDALRARSGRCFGPSAISCLGAGGFVAQVAQVLRPGAGSCAHNSTAPWWSRGSAPGVQCLMHVQNGLRTPPLFCTI